MSAVGERFLPVRRINLPEEVANRLLTLIVDGRLQPGEKLPGERELAAELGVSRPSLRQALRALAMMNILEIRHGDATRVGQLSPESLVRPFEFLLKLENTTILQVFEARKLLEVEVAGLAAERIEPTELALLQATVEAATKRMDDPEAFLLADVDLHLAIASAARNPVLKALVVSIAGLGCATRRHTTYDDRMRAQAAEDHRAIVRAVAGRNAAAARAAMQAHLDHAEATLNRLIGNTANDGRRGGSLT
ncbi:MAG: FadR family transcriptional regulator [Chloroflexota bacterium]|nr:FadR family transcriptional regulator [Chloroflexota bacterium]